MDWKIEDIKVIIPIGGEATRLRPLTVETSKAAVRLLNRPLIEYTLIELARQGIKEFIFGVKGYVNYRSLFDLYKEGIGFSARYHIKPRVHFKYIPRAETVGNAHAVKIALDYYDVNEPSVVVQGDNLFKLDIKKVLEYHEEKGAMMSIVLKKVENVEEFGVADLDNDMRIKKFVEKPKRKEDAPSDLANTGIYILNPKIREVFASDEVEEMLSLGKMDFGKDIIPYLIRKRYPVYGFVTQGLWFDVGTPDRYLDAMLTLLRSLSDEDMQGIRIDEGRRIFVQGTSPDSRKRRLSIKRMYRKGTLKLEGNILIGRHCQIGSGTYIEESAIDNFTIIGENVKIVRSSIMDRVYLGDNAIIENSIIGRHVEIRSSASKPTRIINSIIADDTVIGEGSEITNSKIYPHKFINAESKIFDTVLT